MAVPNRSAQPVVPSSRPHARPARDKSSRRGGRGMGLFTERIAAPRHRRRRRVERKGGGAGDGEGESRGRSDGGSEDIRDGAVEGQQGMERARRTFVVFTRPDTGRELFADTETPFHSMPGGANNHRSLPFPPSSASRRWRNCTCVSWFCSPRKPRVFRRAIRGCDWSVMSDYFQGPGGIQDWQAFPDFVMPCIGGMRNWASSSTTCGNGDVPVCRRCLRRNADHWFDFNGS